MSTHGEQQEEEDVCGICFMPMDPLSNPRGVLNSCEHIFCTFCISAWSASSNHCPHCKQRYTRVYSTTLVPVGESTHPPQKVIDFALDQVEKLSGRKKKAAATNIDVANLPLPNIVVGGPGGPDVRYYELVEEKKIRRKNYRHEEDDDETDEDEDEAENDALLASLLDDDDDAPSPRPTRRSRATTTADPASCGASSRRRGRRATTAGDDEEADALLLGGENSSTLLDGLAESSSMPQPSVPPAAAPASVPAKKAPQRAARGNRASAPAPAESTRRRRAPAAPAALIKCVVCQDPIGDTSGMVSCAEPSCRFLSHAACVGVEENADNSEARVGYLMLDGKTYYCAEHPPQCEEADDVAQDTPDQSTSTAANRRPARTAQLAPPAATGSRAVGPREPPQPSDGPLELGGGDGFVKLPDLPTGTLGTGQAITSSNNWTQGKGNGGSIDTLNSQRLQGIYDLQNRVDLQRRSSNLRIQTAASAGTVNYGAGSPNSLNRKANSSFSSQPVILRQSVPASDNVALAAYQGKRGNNAAVVGAPQPPPPTARGRQVGQKAGRRQEPKTPVLQTLEAVEAEVYRKELAGLRELEHHAKRYREQQITLRPNTWDPFTGELIIPPPESSAEIAKAAEAARKEADRVDAQLKLRAKATAKAYVAEVEKARAEYQQKTESRNMAREQAALLKLQMLIASRRREVLDRQRQDQEAS